MFPEDRKTGSLLKAAVRQRVEEGEPTGHILGHYCDASDWLDLDAEESPMQQDTTWYLSTGGDLYLETEAGRRYYHSSLDPALIQRINEAA